VRELTDRRAERGVLDGLVQAVRAGESRVLVVHGEAGVGKTALLQYLADRASRCRVLRVSGVQWEMELAFAGLHQLCAPLLDRLGVLPGPQQEALRTAFGMSAGPAPDRFLVGLAILHTAIQLPFSLYIMRNSFEAVPRELEEAALTDGGSSFQILRSIYIPAVMPAMSPTNAPNARDDGIMASRKTPRIEP